MSEFEPPELEADIMRHLSHRRPRPGITFAAVLTAVAMLPAIVLGAGSAAAAPAPGYAASLIPIGAEAYAVAVDSATNTTYFSDITADQVSVVSDATNSVGASIPLSGSPRGIAVDAVTDTVYVAVAFSNATGGPAVIVIDGGTDTVTHTIALAAGGFPIGVAVDGSTDTIYVADESAGTVAVINGSTNSVTTTVSTGNGTLPLNLAVDETSDTVWVGTLRGNVLAISGASNSVTQTISLGGAAVGDVAVDPASDTLYAATQTNGVAVINESTGNVDTYIPVTAPQALAVDAAAGTVFASSVQGTSLSGTTWVIDASSNMVVDTIGRGGFGIAVNTATASAYAAPYTAQNNAAWVLAPSAANSMSPVIKSTTATFSAGNPGSFAIVGTALPAATYSETGALPSGMTLSSSGILSGTPATGTGGAYPITITASNGVAPDYVQAFSLFVDEAPAMTAPSTATFTVGTAGTVPIHISGFPVPSVGATSLPPGVTLTQLSGSSWQLSGTPLARSGGLYPVQLTAANGIGNPVTASIAITVREAPGFSGTSATFVSGTAGSVTLASQGFPAPVFSETGKLPAGVTLSSAGVLSGTAAAGTAGVYPIQLTATNVAGTVMEAFTLFVEAPPAIAIAAISPNGVPYAQAPQLGSGWHSLGGRVITPPAVAAPQNAYGASPAKPVFIAPGPNHVLYIRGLTGSWQRLGPKQASCLAAAAVITGRTLTVACEGLNHALYYDAAAVPASGLPSFTTAWKNLGGTISAGPAVAPVGGVLTFFVRGTNGKIYSRTLTTNFTRTGLTCLGQPAAALQVATGTTVLACEGTNTLLYEFTNIRAGWLSIGTLGNVVAAPPAVAATSSAVVSVAELTTQHLYEISSVAITNLGGTFANAGVSAAGLN